MIEVTVAPLVGAWIEIDNAIERTDDIGVAPLVGAWIEIVMSRYHASAGKSRSSCRSVD